MNRMALPTKREDLIAMGYEYLNDGFCTGKECGAPIEWWATPNNKRIPMSVVEVKDEQKGFFAPVERYDRVPHHSVCPNVEDFRKKRT
jgi:hypothetical protein